MRALTSVDKGRQEGAPEARHERLGGARAEFVANLGRRAAELRAALGKLAEDPRSAELREDLWRRLHALGAAARLLRFVKLGDRVGEAAVLLESTAGSRPLTADELAALRSMLDELPALAWGQAALGEPRGPQAREGSGAEARPVSGPQAREASAQARGGTANRSAVLPAAPVQEPAPAMPAPAMQASAVPPTVRVDAASVMEAAAPLKMDSRPTLPSWTDWTTQSEPRPARRDEPTLRSVREEVRAAEVRPVEVRRADPLTALVVGGAPLADALMEDGGAFEVERTDDAAVAMDLARALAPDVIVLDAEIPGARSLVEALTGDPLTEAVPIVALGRFARPEEAAPFIALGVARTMARPASPDMLRRAATEAAATYVRGEVVREPLGAVTLDQLGARLAEELRRGLCDAAEARGRGARVELGEGAEVLAALWGAVARIRDVVTIRSQGAVRFAPRGPEGALPLAPWLGPDSEEPARLRRPGRAEAARDLGAQTGFEEAALEGLGVVVADDDPAVTWFLAGVLRAAGALVHEAHDGARALDLAYQTTPDLVVSDVIMPRLDGFALCRALKRDVVLRDVPVILLSWKEDLLQRLRELGADADGYLRKEASASAIVQRVREVMRARRRVAERIAAGGEVRGRLDGLTTRTLLSLACSRRPASTVLVRDSSFLYEVQIREGRPASATRTAPDGTFQRGPAVLAALLGVGSGRFVVCPAAEGEGPATSRGGFEGSLADQLLPAVAQARAAQRLLSGSALMQVERVDIDEDRMSAYAGATPEPARSLLGRLLAGGSPRALITAGQAPARLVEDVLCDAAARGSVAAVIGRSGEDLLAPAAALEAAVLRGQRRPADMPPTEERGDAAAAITVATSLEQALAGFDPTPTPGIPAEEVEAFVEGEMVPRMTRPWPEPAAMTPAPRLTRPWPGIIESEAAPQVALNGEDETVMPAPLALPAPRGVDDRAARAERAERQTIPARPPTPAPARVIEVAAAAGARPKGAALATLGSLTPPPVAELPPPAWPPAPPVPAPKPASAPREAAPAASAVRPSEAPVPPIAEESPRPRRVRGPSAYAPPAPEAPARDNRTTMWVLAAVAAFVFAVGARLSRDREQQAEAPEAAPQAAQVEAAPAETAAPAEPPAAPAAPAAVGESVANPILPEDMPIPADQKVPDGQGLLEVVAGPNDEVFVDGRLLGKGAVKASLEPKSGPYEIRAKLRGEERVRFARVLPGRLTRLRIAPPWRR